MVVRNSPRPRSDFLAPPRCKIKREPRCKNEYASRCCRFQSEHPTLTFALEGYPTEVAEIAVFALLNLCGVVEKR